MGDIGGFGLGALAVWKAGVALSTPRARPSAWGPPGGPATGILSRPTECLPPLPCPLKNLLFSNWSAKQKFLVGDKYPELTLDMFVTAPLRHLSSTWIS